MEFVEALSLETLALIVKRRKTEEHIATTRLPHSTASACRATFRQPKVHLVSISVCKVIVTEVALVTGRQQENSSGTRERGTQKTV